jgi:peptidoglycan hydrolase CwlO-like protein
MNKRGGILIERTISGMLGKGSFNHNNRSFSAKNVDSNRTYLNVTYCEDNIKQVYHELFDEALERHNAKQTRSDRKIADYYEKIRTGKQEKLFHEVIFQIGNKEDMNVRSSGGEIAKDILSEFALGFQERNPYLRVFSSHLHMDEETPHVHIDFIPFTCDSKRGLDTRVSLKGALATMGFKGGTRGATEWNQWMENEKQELALIMGKYGIDWKQLGTHNKHLSVLDYEKQERAKEVDKLEQRIDEKQKELTSANNEIQELKVENNQLKKESSELRTEKYKLTNATSEILFEQIELEDKKKKLELDIKTLESVNQELSTDTKKLALEKMELLHSKDKIQEEHQLLNNEILQIQEIQEVVRQNIRRYDYPEWTLAEPSGFMSAKTFYESKAFPLVAKFKDAIKKIAAQLTVLEEKIKSLTEDVTWYKAKVKKLVEELFEKDKRIEKLQEKADDLERVKRHAGAEQIDRIIEIERQRDGFYSFNRNQEDKHR